MGNDSKSGNALDGFVKKIDFTKMKETPEDFYKAGLAFIENGQFDDGILEFVKVVKTASIDAPSFGRAIKELKSMGFSEADISAIISININEKTQEVSNSPEATDQEKSMNRKDFWRGVGLFIGLIVLLWMVLVALTNAISFDSPSNEPIIRIKENTPYYFAIGTVILTIFLAFKRPRMALGMLASTAILIALWFIVIIVYLLFLQQ